MVGFDRKIQYTAASRLNRGRRRLRAAPLSRGMTTDKKTKAGSDPGPFSCRHCEEHLRRSNPDRLLGCGLLRFARNDGYIGGDLRSFAMRMIFGCDPALSEH